MKNYIKLLAIPFMALTLLSGCRNNGNISHSAQVDDFGVLPEEVKNFSGNIDIFDYIQGQESAMMDIGHKNYEPMDLWDTTMAKFYAAAKEFNKYAPNVKFNLYYSSIDDYNQKVNNYNIQNGHLPHIMHPVNSMHSLMATGLVTDLSIYKDTSYYKVFDESIMAQYNYGGFQVAIPYQIYPMGLFVNTKILEDQYIEYNEDFVNNLTTEKFYDVLAQVTNQQNAGIDSPVDGILSIAAPTVYKSYVNDKQVDLTSPEINELLALESTITNYTAYRVNDEGNGWTAKDNYPVIPWDGYTSFISDELFAFTGTMPWGLAAMSNLSVKLEKEDQFDYMPYPKANEETEQTVGMMAGGIVIGNQCPIQNGECSEQRQLERDVAAYFTMFMNADPRAIKAKAEIQYTDANRQNVYTGILGLPMVKRNYYYEWETGEDSEDNVKEEIFGYQLGLFLETYRMYWTPEDENDTPDVENYTNIKPGFKKILELFYGDQENVICYNSRPNEVPQGGTGGTVSILADWQNRYFGDGTVTIADSTWAGWVESKLSVWENQINKNIRTAYDYLQEQVDIYYGPGLYDVYESL